MPNSCSVPGCRITAKKGSNIRLHRFPTDVERCKQWINNIQRHDLNGLSPQNLFRSGHVVCSKHFEDAAYNCPAKREICSLKCTAVPTLIDCPKPAPTPSPSSTKTANLYHRKLNVNKDCSVHPGFCSEILSMLKAKYARSNNQSKCVALSLDCISIQPHLSYLESEDRIKGYEYCEAVGNNLSNNIADQVVVFEVRGLSENWKQEIAVFHVKHSFRSSFLMLQLLNAVDSLKENGLKVKCIVMDHQESTQRLVVFKLLGCSIERPYFMHKGMRVFVIWDPCCLLKNVRNNLRNYDIQTPDGILKWSHLLSVFKLDQSDGAEGMRLCPKLTSSHFFLYLGKKVSVRLAAQVLSNSLASALEEYFFHGKLPVDALESVTVVRKLNRAFDLVNSCHTADSDPKSPIPCHLLHKKIEELEELRIWISKWKFIKGTKEFENKLVKQSWLFTLNAIQCLVLDLIVKEGFRWVATRRFNQDHLENLFSKIKSRNQFDNTSTLRQTSNTMKKIAPQKLLGCKRKQNLETLPIFEGKRPKFSETSLPSTESRFAATNSALSMRSNRSNVYEKNKMLPPDKSTLSYIGGLALEKLNLSCDTCVDALESHEENSSSLKHETYQFSGEDSLITISPVVQDILERWENEFRLRIESVAWKGNVFKRLKVFLLKSTPPVLLCPHHPDFFKKLLSVFLKLRIHAFCRFKTRKFRDIRLARLRKCPKLNVL